MPLVRKTSGAPQAPVPTISGTVAGLASPDEEIRWTAARAAAGNAECVAALATALQTETSARVREAMLGSLARTGNAAANAAILPLLRSDDANLRAAALDALRIAVRHANELLPPLLADPDVDVRILSCELARELPAPQATSLLCALLQREQQVNVCAAAVDVLAEAGHPDALPALAACALRFRDTPFLTFSIQVAADRISAQPPHRG